MCPEEYELWAVELAGSSSFSAVVFSSNAKGRSEAVPLTVITLRDVAEKRTGETLKTCSRLAVLFHGNNVLNQEEKQRSFFYNPKKINFVKSFLAPKK